MADRLMAGVATRDISPPRGVELAGYPHHPRHNLGVHDPLYAGCMVLDDGGTPVVLLAMDLLMYSKRHVRTLRESIARACPVPPGNIIVCCSHTHSGPWTSGRLDLEALETGLEPDASYLQTLHERLVELTREAWASRFPATVSMGRGFCGRERGVGGNRRDPGELQDPEVWVLDLRDDSGAHRGCLVRYALHPTFLHSDNPMVSADYPGCIRALFAERMPGAAFLFAQGPSGNQSPRYFRSGKTYAEAVRVGRAIGEEALRVLDTLEPMPDPRLLSRSVEVELELRTLPGRDEASRRVARARERWERAKAERSSERDVWNAELELLGAEDTLGYVLQIEKGRRIELRDDELPAEVQVIGIGDARIVGLPGELFAELGMTIQYRAPFDRTMVIELANGCLPGYACTERAFAQGGYEAGTSLLTGRAGEQLVEAAVALLKQTRT